MLRFIGVMLGTALLCAVLAGAGHFTQNTLTHTASSTTTEPNGTPSVMPWGEFIEDAIVFSILGLLGGLGMGLVLAIADHELWATPKFKQQVRRTRQLELKRVTKSPV
ncbi:hypothetical protein [Poriferisphaera sp. WC338]|uniref:hypothetical protein n=1 Tax=Poriferisphaera sp. WC338 TaxID=3425129 RepID=UPI003D8161E8